MVKLNKRLKASTLIEVIISMVIVLICLSITMTIFSNMARDINDELRILAEVRINTLLSQTKNTSDYTETTVEFENMNINRTLLPYPGKNNVKILVIAASGLTGKKISEIKEIISIENVKQ